MFKGKITAVLALCLVFSMVAWAGDGNLGVANHHMKVLTPEMERAWEASLLSSAYYPTLFPPSIEGAFSGVAGETFYDYATNSITARMVARNSLDNSHIVFMEIFPDSNSTRYVTYNYFDASLQFLFGPLHVDETVGRTGWGRVVNGKNDEAVTVFHGGGAWLYSDVSAGGYSFSNMVSGATPVFPANFPGVTLNPATNEIWYSGSSSAGGGFTPDSFYYSNDYGATFTKMTFPANMVPGNIPGNAESWPILNPANPSQVGMAMTEEDPLGAYEGGLSWHTTTDNGASWNSTMVYEETQWFTDPGGNYNYLVQNFSQFNNMYSDDGTVHIAFNGYGLVDSMNTGDTLEIFPVVYWNSADQQFIELTDPSVGHNIDGAFMNAIVAAYPGNGIGNAYPTLATVGNYIVCLWQQVEVDTNGMPVIADDPNGNPSGFYATDIWGATSSDGGSTWSAPFYVAGVPGQSDVFPVLAREATMDADSVYIDFVYYVDVWPGVSLFGQGKNSLGQWIFVRTGIVLGIDDQIGNIPTEFSLSQNYPNPFNPATTIDFYLNKSTDVKLDVYNLLGQKVTTLIDKKMNAGEHSVVFNAEKLASGVYYYKMTAGDVVKTKKMVLMK